MLNLERSNRYPGPYCITVSNPLGNTLAIAYAESYADAAAFGQSLAHEHPYACAITVSITYPVSDSVYSEEAEGLH